MSSKVLRAGEVEGAAPMAWPAAGGGPLAAAPPPPPQAPGPDAARRMAELEAHAERQAREARQAGYREGEAAGRRAAEEELRPAVERLARSLEEIARLRAALAAQAESSLVKLSIAIARRVLHREVTLDPGALAGIVRAALEKVHIHEAGRVRAHPAEAAVLRAALEQAGCALPVEPDPSLGRGGVVVETARGKLDASLDTQLAEIERGLADRLRSGSS
jgi:flagellar assembly protein FliH